MRRVKVFSGNSHPALTGLICERLGTLPAKCELTKFSNGETSVSIGTSIRDQDVFIVQSGSRRTNDAVMELLIMISACKGGSARSITAVIPYFPYSRQSRKKSHRGAIAARVLANLLNVAGVQHVITVDLHAPPMQGFFQKPVDNLRAEPIIARWIRQNVPNWREGVVVSKNAGGSKRVTSLADALKLSFGIITTDKKRMPTAAGSVQENGFDDRASLFGTSDSPVHPDRRADSAPNSSPPILPRLHNSDSSSSSPRHQANGIPRSAPGQASYPHGSRPDSASSSARQSMHLHQPLSHLSIGAGAEATGSEHRDFAEEYTDERAREVITGRLVQGHIVDDDFPSPMLSTLSGSVATLPGDAIGPPAQQAYDDPMTSSFMSAGSSVHGGDHPLGGTYDAAALSEEEDPVFNDPEVEHTVTLVGDVAGRTVFIIDDIIDKAEPWIMAAETVVKRGGATSVYCIATHALLGEDALERLERCSCIDHVVVCNTFPIDVDRARQAGKLVVLDLAGMLAEAIRRNHHGESIQQLYASYQD